MMPTGGRLLNLTLHSHALVKRMRVHIYLPPGYDENRRYPTAYLLHPWGMDEKYWTGYLRLHEIADRLIEAGTLPPFIGVMPQGDKSFFINAEDPGGDFSPVVKLDPSYFENALQGYGDYGDYILKDVISYVERKLPLRTNRAGRVIGGISMGGAGAAVLAFTHTHLFEAVGLHSPALFTSDHLGPPWIFGLGDTQAFAERDPVQLARQLEPAGMRIYLDCGQDDEHFPAVEKLYQALAAHGVRHTYICRPGGHRLAYWQRHIAEYLGFYAAGW